MGMHEREDMYRLECYENGIRMESESAEATADVAV